MDLKWLAELVASGKKDAEISQLSGVPVHMVAYYRRTGLGIDRSPGKRKKWDIDRDWLAEQVAAGKSDKQIAIEKGMTISAVGQYRRRFKIPPRPSAERAKAAFAARYPNGRMGAEGGNWRGGRSNTGSGYVRIYSPDHPGANSNGYVYEHRLVMERTLGRYLLPGEIVDHIDRNRSNNAPENLNLQASRSAHVKDHFSARDQLLKAQAQLARYKALHGPLPDES
jgi:hypothetical protein